MAGRKLLRVDVGKTRKARFKATKRNLTVEDIKAALAFAAQRERRLFSIP